MPETGSGHVVDSNVLKPEARACGGWVGQTEDGSHALSIFLAMSLMSVQLWTLAGSAADLFVLVAVRTAAANIVFAVFPALGRNYQAAVL